MTSEDEAKLRAAASRLAAVPGLRFVVLHGSRARGEARPDSDWDFAYRVDDPRAVAALEEALGSVIGYDRVDLADVDRAGCVLRHRVADRGVFVAGSTDAWERFRLEATFAWCDLKPVVEPAMREFLESLR